VADCAFWDPRFRVTGVWRRGLESNLTRLISIGSALWESLIRDSLSIAPRPELAFAQLGNDRYGCSTAVMLSRESVDLEQRLAKLLGADPADVRTYLCEVIEERLWGRRPKERKTGFRFVRGTHGGAFVRDPEGNDTPPVGYEVPRATEPGLRRA